MNELGTTVLSSFLFFKKYFYIYNLYYVIYETFK